MGALEFENYYKNALGLSETEWESFLSILNVPLPKIMKIRNGVKIEETRKLINKIDVKPAVGIEDSFIIEDQKDIENYKIINTLNDRGLIQRSELVSMIPPYFLLYNTADLDVVIDTCASPGSKSKIITDLLKSKHCTDGIFIANDIDKKRVNILAGGICENFTHLNTCVTRCNAITLPNILDYKVTHVLCDVPCTCDGTIRKAGNILPKWDIKHSLGIEKLQYLILKRSIQLLQTPVIYKNRKEEFIKSPEYTYCVYSTCSINPIENENVVDKILREFDSVELLDGHEVAKDLFKDSLKFREGITEFEYGKRISYSNKELRKCVRMYPMDNDTGGFFIAYLKVKVKDYTPSPEYKKHFTAPRNISLFNTNFITQSESDNVLFYVSQKLNNFLLSNSHLTYNLIGLRAFSKSPEANSFTYRPTSGFLNLQDFSNKEKQLFYLGTDQLVDINSKYLENIFIITKDECVRLLTSSSVKRNSIDAVEKAEYAGKLLFKVKDRNICFIGQTSKTDISVLLTNSKKQLYLYFLE